MSDYNARWERVLERNGQRCYISTASVSRTYFDILKQAEPLRQLLKEYKGTIVGLAIHDPITHVVATWACVLENKAFFPINLEGSTPQRREQIASLVEFILTDNEYLSQSLEFKAWQEVESSDDLLFQYVNTKTPAESSKNLGYLLQTSGTTGVPKIVCQSRKSLWTFSDWTKGYLDLDGAFKTLSCAPYFFDMSLMDIFVTALCGGQTYIPSVGATKLPHQLLREARDAQVTDLYTTPSLATSLVQAMNPKEGLALKRLILAGEPFVPAQLSSFKECFKGAQIFNFYGPTETNVCFSANLTCDTDVHLGDVVHHCQMDLTSRNELKIKGDTVFAGYLGDLEHADGQYYQTGDQIDRKNGKYYFNGRLDDQFKRFGQRLSLAEIGCVYERVLEGYDYKFILQNDQVQLIVYGLAQAERLLLNESLERAQSALPRAFRIDGVDYVDQRVLGQSLKGLLPSRSDSGND